MAKRYAVIRKRNGKSVAVLFHDPELGRVVFKCRRADWPLQKAFDAWADQDVVVQEPQKLSADAPPVTLRRKIIRFDSDYVDHLLDRFVKRPYEVRDIVSSNSTIRLDDFADQTYKEKMAS